MSPYLKVFPDGGYFEKKKSVTKSGRGVLVITDISFPTSYVCKDGSGLSGWAVLFCTYVTNLDFPPSEGYLIFLLVSSGC